MQRNYILAIGWTIAILAACSIPGRDIPKISFDLFEPDKLAHFTLFLVFGWLWLEALPVKMPRKKIWVGIFGVLYAILTEVYQGLLPFDRTPDPMDSLANTIGLIVALGSYDWIRMRIGLQAPEKT